MRSIGKWKIKKLKAICKEELDKAYKDESWRLRTNAYTLAMDVEKAIRDRIPAEWYDTWEMAYQEIDRLVDDFINDYRFGGRG